MKKLTTIFISSLLLLCNTAIGNQEGTKSPELDPLTKKSFEKKATITVEPNGQLTFNPNGGYVSTTLTRIGKNGNLETYCTSNANKAKRFLAGDPIVSLGVGE